MSQKEAFLTGEGEAWLERNKNNLTGKSDPVLEAIEKYKLDPVAILEIGCANGWRLDALREKYDCTTWGIDPAPPENRFNIRRGTADKTHLMAEGFDVIIYGWCLYLCDPEDYFKIATEGDRVLADGGFLIVYDFNDGPYKTKYKHKEGLFSYHYDFSKLWLSHPAYSLYGRTVQDTTCVTILKKNLASAFPEEK